MKVIAALIVALLAVSGVLAAGEGFSANQGASFSYQNAGGWEGVCQSGREQSPIDLKPSDSECERRGVFKLRLNSFLSTLENTGQTLKVAGPIATLRATDVNGKLQNYVGTEFQFHSPSEHSVDGVSLDLELQLVFRRRGGDGSRRVAIVSIFFDADHSKRENPFIEALGISHPGEVDLDLQELLDRQFHETVTIAKYSGSLTTPGCDEVVDWNVILSPLRLSSEQLARFRSYWAGNKAFADGKGNNRPTQKLNGREVVLIGRQCRHRADSPEDEELRRSHRRRPHRNDSRSEEEERRKREQRRKEEEQRREDERRRREEERRRNRRHKRIARYDDDEEEYDD